MSLNLNKLFQPKSLAIVGGYWADFVVQGNRKLGFKGSIWHINPTRKSNKKNNAKKEKFCIYPPAIISSPKTPVL